MLVLNLFPGGIMGAAANPSGAVPSTAMDEGGFLYLSQCI